jgi:hypothetical protein
MRANRSLLGAGAALASSLALVTAMVAPVAARSEIFTISIDLDEGGAGERFESDSALLCPEGEALTDFERFSGAEQSAGGSFHLTKLIVCDDGSGSFVIRVDAGANFVVGTGTTGGWSVVPGSGTGDYVGLRGGGSIVGTNVDDTGDEPFDLVDRYYGRLSL